MLDAAASGIAADFYEWRKQVTYHALQLALLSPLAHGPSERRCKVMAQLAELLGRHHDFEALDLYLESKAPLASGRAQAFPRRDQAAEGRA